MFWRTFILLTLGVVNVVLFYRMVWSPNGILAFKDLKEQHTALVAKVAELDRNNVQLSREIRLLQSDNAYVEKMIRQRLHYVRDNEVLYLFTDAQASQRPGVTAHEGKN